jgi:hypothetical protein
VRRALVALLLLGTSGIAHAHGGLPVTQKIMRIPGDETLYVPVVYWGIWVGGIGKPWTWICEEAINTYRGRHMALSTDGTFYTTDNTGIELSTDRGCTWVMATGEVGTRRITDVTVDPTDGATAWVTSAQSGGPAPDGGTLPGDNALYVTHDHGTTFNRVPGLASQNTRLFQSVRIGATAQTIYVSSTTLGGGVLDVHRSLDGGANFTTLPLNYILDGIAPYGIEVMGVDPRDPMVVYLKVYASGFTDADAGPVERQALLRSIDGGASFTELTKLNGIMTPSGMSRGIDGLAFDTGRNKVLVATAHGLLAGDDPGSATTVTLQPIGTLSQAQCVDVHGSDVYACSTNYMPDFSALAHSTDGAQSFQSILEFVDTKGPVDCPKGTPVGDTCPFYWEMYGSSLGISFTDGGVQITDGGGGPQPKPGCSCEVGARTPQPLGTGLLLVPLVLGLALVRRRARRG